MNLLRRCKYLMRKYRFQELSLEDQQQAMLYLQRELAAVIDHNSEAETQEVNVSYILYFRKKSSSGLMI